MKKIAMMTGAMALALLSLSSCKSLADADRVSANPLGGIPHTSEGTVVSPCRLPVASSDYRAGTGRFRSTLSRVPGGQAFGSGSGRIGAAAGGAVAGYLGGGAIAKGVGQVPGQQLTIRSGSQTYTVTQQIFKQYGEIPVGTKGELRVGSRSQFVPYYAN